MRLDTGLFSARTVQYTHTVLQHALKQAVNDGLIPRSPCDAVDPPQVSREEIQPLDRDQVRTLFDAARGDRLEALYTVAVHCGLRQGELLGLKWEDVNLQDGTLQVRRTLSNGEFTAPKTAKSRRQIKLTAGSVAALKAHRKRQPEERMERAGLWQDQGLVFASEVGTPISRHNLTRRWKALLKRARLPQSIRFHDLRHTCATLLLSRSVHPKIVQELLGHATIAITLDTYSHLLKGMGDAAAGAMDDALKDDQAADPGEADEKDAL